MWVNVDFSLSVDEIIDYLKTLDSSVPIYVSFNTLCQGKDILKIIPEFTSRLESAGLNIQIGPHFVEEGCIINGNIEIFDELYFSTNGEKIVWFTKHFSLPEDITTIILLSANLGIEPIIIHMKDKSKKYQYVFVQKEKIAEDMKIMGKSSNWNLSRMKNE